MDAKEIIKLLKLKRHLKEGGYFAETYRSKEKIPGKCLPVRYSGARPCSTAIYYLITADSFSAMHRLRSDEIFHFYLGDPVEMLQLFSGGKGRVVEMGNNIRKGQRLQVMVTRGVWQGTRLKKGGRFALLGTTVAPGFDFKDYEHGNREKLIRRYPRLKRAILALTVSPTGSEYGPKRGDLRS